MTKIYHFFTLILLAICFQALGALSNHVVTTANMICSTTGDCYPSMPVWGITNDMEVYINNDLPRHRLLTKKSHYKVLTDIIPIPSFYGTNFAIRELDSIGDVFLDVSELLWSFVKLAPFVLIFYFVKWLLHRKETK